MKIFSLQAATIFSLLATASGQQYDDYPDYQDYADYGSQQDNLYQDYADRKGGAAAG